MNKTGNIILIVAACLTIPVGIVGTVHSLYYNNLISVGGIHYRFNNDIQKYSVVGIDKNDDDSKQSSITIRSEINGFQVYDIKNGAFKNLSTLEEITFPITLTTIEKGAFKNCVNLKKINDKCNKLLILNGAFYKCNNIESYSVTSSKYVYSCTNYIYNYDYNDYKKLLVNDDKSNWNYVKSYLDETNALIKY